MAIQTRTQDQITLNFTAQSYWQLEQKYTSFSDFIDRLKSLSTELEKQRSSSNINPYPDRFKGGIYILGHTDQELKIFPSSNLALKCSQGHFLAEDLKRQFDRSLQLAQLCQQRLSREEQDLLQVCPVYLHLQNRVNDAFFKQILFMQRVEGTTLAEVQTGFSEEFCRVFRIPTIDQIRQLPQFALHRWLDRNRRRQLVKIQTAYLFRYLWKRGIRILSLNQRNIIVSGEDDNSRYTIIDPIPDYLKPASPLYNLLTSLLCTDL
ncbi:hypothetical protein H6F67_09930 [Microcoleus sp. FACHB-1515]|uniref:hypothetical protein n=1 Tax=Cyanophyceae TaxID=3028117 RepID=UPI001681F214|nr:hypothetical protein [Microcoleus sp. FACHB-1515]MBD2090172.1 hypothetical protein [Microcoleus sp. FACHB-1515]